MKKKRVLVIDDDQDILEPIALLLESEGYMVATITKGNETYTKVKEFAPNIILLDILMSGSDGRTICKKLKQTDETKHIPIVMMSAHPGADKDSVDAGADDFIAKPFETADLLQILIKTLS